MEILSLAVKKPWRRQGVATSLLQASIQFAKGAGLCGCSIDHPIGSDFTEALGRLVSEEKGWEVYSESILVTADFTTPEIFDLQKRLQSTSLRQQRQWGWHVEPYPSALTSALKARLLDPNIPKWARPIDLSQFPESDQVLSKHSENYVLRTI